MTKEQIQALIDSAISGQGNQVDIGGVLPNILSGIMEAADEKFSILESELGINLDPDLDKKYYEYFTLEAKEDGTTVYFRQSSFASDDGLDPLKVEVSTDGGETWEEKTASVAEDDTPGTVIANLDAGEKVLIRGTNKAYGYYSDNESDLIENCNFYADSPCYVYGNIMSLVGGDDFARLIKVEDYAFTYFFSDYDGSLDWSWVLSKEGRELLLPATTLAKSCYNYMFNGCVGLSKAPALPARTLAQYCYNCMFQGCTSLTEAPALPAITLAYGCYGGMFNGCTSLTEAPVLPATTLAQECYNSMFYGCTSLTEAPALPATTLAEGCYNSMFQGCTSLTEAPALPATILAQGCYRGMFSDCTSLTEAPALPATTLVQYCYGYMFGNCTKLAKVACLATDISAANATSNWLSSVAAAGTFTKAAGVEWTTGASGIPSGWTVEEAS